VRTQARALACELPSQRDVPLSRYAHADIAAQLVAEQVVTSIARSTVARWLHQDALRPWRVRSWIFPRDPLFAEKAGVVLDLYARRFHGRACAPMSS
jgi:hypothetical protein